MVRRPGRRPVCGAGLRGLLLGLLVLGAVACGSQGATAEGEADEVTFALAWLPTADAAGWYSAMEHGWFADQGIDIEIARGYGSGDTAQRVATGEADFGVVDMAALVPMRLNEDLPLVAIAAVYAEPFHGVTFRADDGIAEPRDLEGRTIACSAGNANMLMFPAFAEATGIDGDAVDWQLGDPASITAAFLGGQADGACNPVPEQPFEDARSDIELGHFYFVEHDVSVYSQMLVASERTIEERPELVERFLAAALRGLEHAVEHPEAAVDVLADHNKDLDPDLAHESWALILALGLMTNEHTEAPGLGHIDEDRMRETVETLLEALDLGLGGRTAEDFYTIEFLP